LTELSDLGKGRREYFEQGDRPEVAVYYWAAVVVGTCHDFSRGSDHVITGSELQIPCRRWPAKGWSILSFRCYNCSGGEMPRLRC